MQDFMTRTALNEANARLLAELNKNTRDITTQIAVGNNATNALLAQDNQTDGSWLSKDRLWNLIFWFGMSSGLSLALNFEAGRGSRVSFWSVFFFWLTIIGIPLILKMFNGTKFIKALTFANSEGQILTEEQRPYLFLFAMFAGIPLVFIVAERIFPKNTENFFLTLIGLIIFFAPISLYFIYKNCPISILFNHKFWTVDGHPNVALLKKVAKIIKDD